MKTIVFFTACLAQLFSQVIITEVMYDLDGTDSPNEFVELFNSSSTNIADLTNWTISDKYSTDDLTSVGYGIQIPPLEYAVIFEGDYDISSGIYNSIIPPSAILIKVDDNSIGNSLSTNDSLYLKDNTNNLIDSFGWIDIAPDGFSIEKVRLELSNTPDNRRASKDSLGTPGRPNSVAPLPIDGAILTDGIIISPEFPESTEPIQITIPVVNNGLQTIAGNVIIKDNNFILTSSIFNEVGMSDTTFLAVEIPSLPSGQHAITIFLEIIGDEDLDNNIALIPILVSYDFGFVTINEFLADPEPPLSEFIEIVSSNDIDLTGWAISDNRKELKEFSAGIVEADTYIVLSEDTSLVVLLPSDTILVYINNFPSLNNSGDGIFLYDFTGKTIDSLDYNSDWPLKNGKSTEKLHPDFFSNDASRWQVSTDISNSTIGRLNSVMLQNVSGAILPELTNHYPEFPHPSESISFDIAVINNGISDISGSVSVTLDNQVLGTGSFSSLISEDTTFVSFNIEPLSSGNNLLEIALDVSYDMNTSDNVIEYNVYVSYPFGAVVFNEFLAKPDIAQAEFLEIIGFSNIDLTDWSISDDTLKKYYFGELLASANQLVVIAYDSTFIANLSQGTLSAVPIDGWPTLNNSDDALILYDATGAIIDSLKYNSDWPLADGRSTEKFRPEFESHDVNRWGIAVNAEAMTPGLVNSLHFDGLPDKGTLEFAINPFSPNGDGINDELLVKYRLPYEQGIIKLQIFDMTGRNIATPYWNVYFPQEGLLKWNGKRDDGEVARIGIYIVRFTAKDPASSKVWEKVKTIVLAKQL